MSEATADPKAERAALEAALGRHFARRLIIIAVGAVVLIAAIVISTGLGVQTLSPDKTARALMAPILPARWLADISPVDITVIQQLRLPRALLAVIGGACLSMAGVGLQGVTRNPLVSPFTLGISWAAAFGASVALLLGLGSTWVVVFAFASALICGAMVLGFSAVRGVSSILLVLGGVGLSYLFQALSETARFMASEQQLSALVQWAFGSINGATWNEVFIAGGIFIVVAPVLVFCRWPLNAFAAGGDQVAASLGFAVGPVRVAVTVAAVLLTTAIVAFAGVIAFVGLVSPHIARLLIGGDHRTLLPFSAIVGALLVLLADLIGRTVFAPVIIPVGIVVAYIAVPIFLHLLLTRRQELSL